MSLDLSQLDNNKRLLFEIPLKPIQGSRFQPTGFPGLGPATFQNQDNHHYLLIESAQSMANRLELTVWDSTLDDVNADVRGISHVRICMPDGGFLTDTILESHRLNSPYLLEDPSHSFLEKLKSELGVMTTGPINRKKLAEVLLKYDVGCLLHGVFLAKKELAGGRLRIARALSAFIEAEDIQVAASGGVKNDHVNPSWPKKDVEKGFGNVLFSRDEFTARAITLYVNLDLTQIRGYGLGPDIERLLILLALYKLRSLTEDGLKLRTVCDLEVDTDSMKEIVATSPLNWPLPPREDLVIALKPVITACADRMPGDVEKFTDQIRVRKDSESESTAVEDDDSYSGE